MLACVLQPMHIDHGYFSDASSSSASTCAPSTSELTFFHRTPSPTPEELRFFGLQPVHEAECNAMTCAMCHRSPTDPVLTECSHNFCFGCIYQWFGRSVSCPCCEQDLHSAQKPPPTKSAMFDRSNKENASPTRYSSSQWVRNTATTGVSRTPRKDGIFGHRIRGSGSWKLPQKLLPNRSSSSASFQHRNEAAIAPTPGRAIRRIHHSSPSLNTGLHRYPDPTPPQQTIDEETTSNSDSTKSSNSGSTMSSISESTATSISESPTLLESMNGSEQVDTMLEQLSACWTDLQREHEAPEQTSHHLKVNSQQLISDMWTVCDTLAQETPIPLRCRAIAKCIWREWEFYLKTQHGDLVTAQELSRALHQSLEETVVDYGWVQDWTELPVSFLHILEKTIAVVTQRF